MPLYTANPVRGIAPVPTDKGYVEKGYVKSDYVSDNNDPTIIAPVDTASYYGNYQYNGNIISKLDGAPWTVTYYTQLNGPDDVIGNSNDVNDRTLKQYQKIENFELRVIDNLNPTIANDTATSTIVGSANVYPVLAPQPGDVIVGVSEGNIFGVFEVTGIDRKSLYTSAAWTITYSQIDYSTKDIYDIAEKFVVETFVFDSSKLDTGSNPLFGKAAYIQYASKNDLINNLIDVYYNNFYDNKTDTFLVPNASVYNFYDPFIIDFWNKIIVTDAHIKRPVPVAYNTSNGFTTKKIITVFDAYLGQSVFLLNTVSQYMNCLDKGMFAANYQRHTLIASAIDYVIFPYSATSVKSPVPKTVLPFNSLTDLEIDCNDNYVKPGYVDQGYVANSPPVDPTDTSYIFSDLFYTGQPGQTLLESLVTKAINKQSVSFKDVNTVVNNLSNIPLLDQFYTMPFIISLSQLAR